LKTVYSRYIFYTIEFEFDPRKSRPNKKIHGINFDDSRYPVVGRIGEIHWSSEVAYREDRIRIISVRRSRGEEIERYES
jgi:uncharacterized DUF497 family protein